MLQMLPHHMGTDAITCITIGWSSTSLHQSSKDQYLEIKVPPSSSSTPMSVIGAWQSNCPLSNVTYTPHYSQFSVPHVLFLAEHTTGLLVDARKSSLVSASVVRPGDQEYRSPANKRHGHTHVTKGVLNEGEGMLKGDRGAAKRRSRPQKSLEPKWHRCNRRYI